MMKDDGRTIAGNAPELPRMRPAAIPEIRPLPEYLATGARKAIYDDTKAVLQVPWMGVVAMAFAHYPRFYETLWQGVRPLCMSEQFVSACRRLRALTEDAVQPLAPPAIGTRLSSLGYASREVTQIAEMIEIFSHGNFPYALMATQARLLLEGHALSGDGGTTPFTGRHGPETEVPFVLMEPHHTDRDTRTVFDDVKATLGLPFVNTDYRALSRWPSYFALAWDDLRAHLATPGYAQIVDGIHQALVDTALALPNPGGLRPEVLQAAADDDATVEEVREVVRLFQWLLPGLATNVAFFRAQMVS